MTMMMMNLEPIEFPDQQPFDCSSGSSSSTRFIIIITIIIIIRRRRRKRTMMMTTITETTTIFMMMMVTTTTMMMMMVTTTKTATMTMKDGVWVFFPNNLIPALKTISNIHAHVAKAQLCANHVKHIQSLPHATRPVLHGAKSQLSN